MTDFSRLEKQLELVARMVDTLEMATSNGHTVEIAWIPTGWLLIAFDYPPLRGLFRNMIL